jgi:hypothetical protein
MSLAMKPGKQSFYRKDRKDIREDREERLRKSK